MCTSQPSTAGHYKCLRGGGRSGSWYRVDLAGVIRTDESGDFVLQSSGHQLRINIQTKIGDISVAIE